MDLKQYRQTLAVSISQEVEAYQFYKHASTIMTNPMLSKLFLELSEEERNHMLMLQSFLSDESLPFTIDKPADFNISESVVQPAISAEMPFVEAIAFAMKNEEEAMKRYSALSTMCSDPSHKKMFENLANMETGHKVRLEEIYTNAAYAEDWNM